MTKANFVFFIVWLGLIATNVIWEEVLKLMKNQETSYFWHTLKRRKRQIEVSKFQKS